ncbi:TerD family protein [Jatrophihabitans fulvus]
MTELNRGGNTAVPTAVLELSVTGAAPGTVDLFVLQLTAARTVRSDADLVFFNQPTSPEGAVRLTSGDAVTIDPAAVPADVAELVVAVALDDGVPGSLRDVPGLGVRVGGGADVQAPAVDLTSERAAALVELYRRGDGWKLRNVSAGWDGGLADLVREFGVNVDGEPPADAPAAPPPPSAPPTPSAAAPAGTLDLGKRTGRIDMVKGQRVSIEKSDLIVASIEWPPDTDYDVFALIHYADGHSETVATFGTDEDESFSLTSSDGAVRHLGDVGRREDDDEDDLPPPPDRVKLPGESRKDRKAREAREAAEREARLAALRAERAAQAAAAPAVVQERIEIRPHPGIVAITPVAYSAQSNGEGSFRRYRVSMAIDNGRGTTVRIDAANADDDDFVFSCVPGVIRVDGADVTVDAVEQYSASGSERRPVLAADGTVTMDAGPENDFK